MEVNEYQNQIRDYVEYPEELGPFSVILSLQNNVGKLAEKLNDSLTNDHGQFSKELTMKCIISLGDILFDLTNIAFDLGYTMNDVISLNITKHRLEKDKKEKEQKEKEQKQM